MAASKTLRFETIAVHAGRLIDNGFGAVAMPIYPSTTFERASDGSFPHGYVYARYGNPNRSALEACLAELEGGSAAAAFSSGQAATMAIIQLLGSGDHLIAPRDAFFGTSRLMAETFARWGIACSFVDQTEPGNVAEAIRPTTKLVWLETPSNPLLAVTDIASVVEVAHQAGVQVACDNTWATPYLTRPLDLGVDLVMHSTTKYLGGHCDVLGGAVIARAGIESFERIRSFQGLAGAVPSPNDCWLTMRGIRTLPYRMAAHCANAQKVAEFLQARSDIDVVHYPGLPDHPGHAVAVRQMKTFGGMLSAEVAGGRERAIAVAARCEIFTAATSLGGVESLIEHRASVEPADSTTPPNLLRLSVGVEHVDDLIEDLSRALDGVGY